MAVGDQVGAPSSVAAWSRSLARSATRAGNPRILGAECTLRTHAVNRHAGRPCHRLRNVPGLGDDRGAKLPPRGGLACRAWRGDGAPAAGAARHADGLPRPCGCATPGGTARRRLDGRLPMRSLGWNAGNPSMDKRQILGSSVAAAVAPALMPGPAVAQVNAIGGDMTPARRPSRTQPTRPPTWRRKSSTRTTAATCHGCSRSRPGTTRANAFGAMPS